jgi:lysozyme
MIEGIDVSNHQGHINWKAVADAGKVFAFMKATEGLNFVDPFLGLNWSQSKEHGLFRGAYHYARPEQGSGADQALFFLNELALEPGDLLALDLEDGPPGSGLGAFALDFLKTCHEETGCRPVLYTGTPFIQEHAVNQPALSEYGLWLAAWRDTMPPAPTPWNVIAFWQFSATMTCPGVIGKCDLDRFNSDDATKIPEFGVPG